MFFYRADADGNGKLTREEFEAFFERADRGGTGFLSLSDSQDLFNPPPRGRGSSGGSQGPTRRTLLKGLFAQEIGSLQPGPKVGERAPDFTLRAVGGDEEVTLSKLVGPKPVVLVFGNFTCGPFRSQAGNVEKLYRQYKDRATFVMVYVREAHPTDGWSMESNNRVGVELPQPRSYAERVGVAQQCATRLDLGFPMLVDELDDRVGARYSGMPSRLYVIDRDGLVAYKSGRGPFGFKPREMEQSLLLVLSEEDQSTETAGAASREER
jgi:thiol-disulfide isomerase/thioredoxin